MTSTGRGQEVIRPVDVADGDPQDWPAAPALPGAQWEQPCVVCTR